MFDFSILIIAAVLFVAYANGANDNFKGVATLFGSGTADYDTALGWATITTAAGSVTALFLDTRLISIFQGNGLVPPSLVASEPFVAAVVLGAGAVSFARGLNDTPKIVALALVGSALDLIWFIGLVAVVMALGGLMGATKVAETVSKRITSMDPVQGFLANLVTSFLVIFTSRWGLPASTTHVSCGALFGLGIANGQARWGVIRAILLAWVLTLPIAAVSAGFIYAVLSELVLR